MRNDPDEASLAATLLEGFAALSADGHGITRPAYSAIESDCLNFVAEVAAPLGLEAHRDAVGNLWLAPPGLGDAPAPACGSHMDSVPQGGNFDGGAGVVAGLLIALRAARDALPMRALALRGEESPWFGAPYVGTRAAFGALDATELARPRRDTGKSLSTHLREIGGDPAVAGGGKPVPELLRTTAFHELHIEQGPVLVDKSLPAAAVSAVRGHRRWSEASCTGEAGHSGVVPRHLRADPMMAVAELLYDLDTLWAKSIEDGADMVITAGMVSTEPDLAAVTRIPGRVAFSLDIRSGDRATLDAAQRFVARRCADIAAVRRVRFDMGPLVQAAPIRLDSGAVEAALPEPITLVSGAGHDAAEFARRGMPASMVFVRNRNGSHNPQEAMEIPDLMAGVDALYAALRPRA
ncbi:hydantoinase/carbamoylase family amidase [Roseomonas sp. CCTCC AB2023176]|uniref:hydantoinase/carbamoylase family amidase n=1 Tax=Roseomonas sp. CCTCC AB2023176 TaxID=3342640 RepID=UPI0035D5743D